MRESFAAGVVETMTKMAKDKDKQPSWLRRQMAVGGMTATDRDLAKKKMKGSLKGLAIGAGIGGLGLGAAMTHPAGFAAVENSLRKVINVVRRGGAKLPPVTPEQIREHVSRGKRFGMGALVGLGFGANIGSSIGAYKATKPELLKRGITPRRWGMSHEFSPEAQKKYLGSK